jgi:alpha-L-fucosidase 2
MVNHNTDIFGRTGIHDNVNCGFFPLGGSWLCMNLWEHYEFTNDVKYLEEIYPILKGSCEFICDFLVEAPDGTLVTCPSNSPEHRYKYMDGNGKEGVTMMTYASTMDIQIIHALFTRMIHSCKVLNRDAELVKELEQVLDRLPPMKLSERYDGTLCEWIKDFEETEPGHRHISHLFGLYPGDQINEDDPVIYEAAKRTLKRRMDNGGGVRGWSCAWVANFFARLRDGEQSISRVLSLFRTHTANNLFDLLTPFQIDGNFGATAAIVEVLIQSHLGSPNERIIELLPALPEDWKAGSVKGIKARGNFTFDFDWENGKLNNVSVKSGSDNVLRLKLRNGLAPTSSSKEYILKDSVLEISMSENEVVELTF